MTQMDVRADREIYDDGPLYAAAAKICPLEVDGPYRRLEWIALVIALVPRRGRDEFPSAFGRLDA